MEYTKSSIFVDVNEIKVNGFNTQHLLIHDKSFNKEANPEIYQDSRWVLRKSAIVDIDQVVSSPDDIVSGGYTTFQPVRATNNKAYNAIGDSIEERGWHLGYRPPIVHIEYDDDGTEIYVSDDGRTRISHAKKLGFKNIIVHIFEIIDVKNAFILGMKCNSSDVAKGDATEGDYVQGTLTQIQNGNLDLGVSLKRYISAKGEQINSLRNKIYTKLFDYVKDLSNHTLNKPKTIKICNRIINGLTTEPTILQFPQGKGVIERYRDVLGLHDEPNMKYVSFSGDNAKEIYILTMELEWLAENPNNQIKVLFYSGSIDNENPLESWLQSTRDSACRLAAKKELIERVHLSNGSFNNLRCVSYGVIPQLKSLEHKFPLDKVIHLTDLEKEYPSIQSYVITVTIM